MDDRPWQPEQPPGDEQGFHARCVAYLDGEASAEDLRLLERDLIAHAERRAAFVRLCVLRARVVETVRATTLATIKESDLAGAFSAAQADDVAAPAARNFPALAATSGSDDLPSEALADPLAPIWREGRRRTGRTRRLAWAAAIGGLALVGTGYLARTGRERQYAGTSPTPAAEAPTTPARLVSTIDADWAGEVVRLGDAVADRPLSLRAGLAEVRLANGVVAVLQGPAELRVVSAQELKLDAGTVTVTVPPNARGFAVQTANARIVDLGTEFGVTSSAEQTETFVLKGSVRAYPMTAGADRRPALCTAGNGAIVNAVGARLVTRDAMRSGERYVADIRSVRQPVPVFGTGRTFDARKGNDVHWQVAAVTDGRVGPFEGAFPTYDPHYQPNEPRSRWISLPGARQRTPTEIRFRFRTRFDLTGFDPKTMRLVLQLGADDAIDEVYLNGSPTGIRLKQYNVHRLTEFVLDSGFVEGTNRLEVALVNIGEGDGDSIFALRAKLDGTAFRRVASAGGR